jgi:alkylhydroperoxidase/carboxymuconolactone decarboxylase family protein YurZ
MDFLALLKRAGFKDVEIRGETGLNSSPITRGMLFYAVMPSISAIEKKEKEVKDPLETYQEFFNQVYADGTIDRKTKHLIGLSASLAAGCEP